MFYIKIPFSSISVAELALSVMAKESKVFAALEKNIVEEGD